MSRRRFRSELALPMTTMFIVVLALLPARWLEWTNDISAILHLPITPFGEAGNRLAGWLRPPPGTRVTIPGDAEQVIRNLREERDRFERLYRLQELRAEELEEQLSQLQKLPLETLELTAAPKIAWITGRDFRSPTGAAELKGGRQARHRHGMVGVYNAVHLIGRVTAVSQFRSILTPVTDPAAGLIIAVVVPRDRPETPVTDAPRIQLIQNGDGTFTADADRAYDIRRGDIVQLADPAWPPWAQAMTIGTVEDVAVKDEEPLRHTLIVQPRFQLDEISYVTLLAGADELEEGGEGE